MIFDVATASTRTSQSNHRGLCVESLLPPGRYTLEVTKQGFKVASWSEVQVIVAETTVQNIPMKAGAVTETVSVAASGVELETESSELGSVMDSEMLENLPLVTRNSTQIIGLNAGVSQEVNKASGVGRGGGSQDAKPGAGSIMSQGANSTDNRFQMNDLSINDTQGSWIYSQGIPAPNPETTGIGAAADQVTERSIHDSDSADREPLCSGRIRFAGRSVPSPRTIWPSLTAPYSRRTGAH